LIKIERDERFSETSSPFGKEDKDYAALHRLRHVSVLRGGYGFYGDSLFIAAILQNNDAQNTPEFGPEYNLAGKNEVAQAAALNQVIASGQEIFQTYQQALSGTGTVKISTFDRHFRPSTTQQYDLNLQHSFSSKHITERASAEFRADFSTTPIWLPWDCQRPAKVVRSARRLASFWAIRA
jgi:hypothetical protein